MKHIKNPIDPLLFQKFSRRRKPTSCFSKVVGFDVETKNGFAKIGSTNFNWMKINNIEDVFTFLCDYKHRSKRNFFFNLKFDFECLFKHDLDFLINLTTSNQYETDRYKIFYISGKMLKITDKHQKRNFEFFDIYPFYLNSLKNCSKKYLNQEVSDLKGDRSRLFELYNDTEIGEYCQDDATKTKLLAELFINNLEKINLFPKKLISCGNVSEQYTLKNADIPKFYETPRPIQDEFWKSYRGGWFDTWKRGFFPKAFQYDIKSAYPHIMRNLLDVRCGSWVNYLDPKQKLGIVKVQIDRGEDSCLSTKLKDRTMSPTIYPFFDLETTNNITLSEYNSLKHFYKIDIINAWTFIPNELKYPYRKIVNNLFSEKEKSRSDISKYLVLKQIFNSFYGKTVQKRKAGDIYTVGSLFNPVYATEITAGCRLQMWDLIKNNKKKVVSIMTDGIITTKKLKVKLGSKLGEWTTDYQNKECVILRTGVYQFKGCKPKRRGMMKLPDLIKELKGNNKEIITLHYKRPRHYKESIIQKKAHEIGVFLDVERMIHINNDVKRIWTSKPKKASELLENTFHSLSIPVSLI